MIFFTFKNSNGFICGLIASDESIKSIKFFVLQLRLHFAQLGTIFHISSQLFFHSSRLHQYGHIEKMILFLSYLFYKLDISHAFLQIKLFPRYRGDPRVNLAIFFFSGLFLEQFKFCHSSSTFEDGFLEQRLQYQSPFGILIL